MQVSALSLLKKTSLAKKLTLGLKVALFLGMLFFLGMKLWQHQDSWRSLALQLGQGWQHPANAWVGAALLLVPLNWWLEALKWQALVKKIQPASLAECNRAVLAGLSLGMLTPRSLGDYAGRMLVHGPDEKVRMVGVVLLNRLVQSLSTFAGGLLGILVLVGVLGTGYSRELLWLLAAAFLGSALMLLLLGPLGNSLIRGLQQRLGQGWLAWLAVVRDYSAKEIALVNAWALLRYAVFSLQFLLLLWWAGILLPLPLLLAGIAATFLIKTLVPAFNFLSDLGVREFSALLIFSLLEQPQAGVVAASLLLWLLNLCLPALAGAVIVLQVRHKFSFR